MDVSDLFNQLKPQFDEIDKSLDRLNSLTIQITETPAPPFMEQERGLLVADLFKAQGYQVRTDTVGNVLAGLNLNHPTPVILSAHLDTVFSNRIIKVDRREEKLFAPGVGDDSRGLACLLLISELLRPTPFASDIVFVATVGEEGLGDLRGVKHVFSETYNWKPKYFITIDGTGTTRIVDQGIGSLRYRLYFRGPGGHSYGSFGTVNPAFALGDFMASFSLLKPRPEVLTTFSLGVVGGGTSINAIPEEVWVDIDLRSELSSELESLNEQIHNLAEHAANKETSSRLGDISFEFEAVGHRPPGKMDDPAFREVIQKVQSQLGIETNFTASSTDANVPLNQGIPAISVAGVELAGRAHTQDEWIDASEGSLVPVRRNLLLVCAAVQL
ncbi:MAG: M20/M25/M40 family metallo-hydrolase [Candidatus Kariarchaeaceae archaeon]